jgi:predicted RND superfamily exporter protein
MSHLPKVRRASIVLLGIALCLPVLIWGAAGSMTRVQNAPAFWLPKIFPEREAFEDFSKRFGVLDNVLVSWEGCTVDDKRLAEFAEILHSERADPEDIPLRDLFPEVLTGYHAVRQLQREPLRLSREDAIRRLSGILVGPDGRSSAALLAISPLAGRNRERTIALLRQAAARATGLSDSQIYIAGSIIDGAVVDRESVRVMTVYGLPAALISFLVCWWCLRSLIQTLAVIAVATIGQILVLAIVWYAGLTMNAVLAVMAPLVFVVTVSGGVHLSNYFTEQFSVVGPKRAVQAALRAGWLPCTIAAVTTAIGTASLAASQIVPVRQFGIIATVGILVTLGLLFLILPGAMEIRVLRWEAASNRPDQEKRGTGGGERSFSKPWVFLRRVQASLSGVSERIWEVWGHFLLRHWPTLLVICGVTAALGVLGLPRMRTSVNVRNLLVPESPVLAEYRWLEEKIGPLVPVEVVVHFDRHCPLDVLERVEIVRAIEEAIRQVPEVGGVSSAAAFLPPIPQASGTRGTIRRTVLRNRLEARLSELARAHWFHEDGQGQWWRVSGRLPAFSQLDYSVHLQHIEDRVEGVLAKTGRAGVHVIYTGLTTLVDKSQKALLEGMFLSFLSAFAVVALVLVLVLGGFTTAAVAMLPNIFPSVVIFGLLGLQDIRIDIGSVMTASVALGIAVDGTVHYLTWYKRELQEGASNSQAVCKAFHHCAWAMVEATFICICGFLLFVFSSFLPMRRFAIVMSQLLIAALVGDLVLLPAILLSPVGQYLFARKAVSMPQPVSRGIPVSLESVAK